MSYFTAMKTNSYWVIGVMSGTSLDGIDLAYLHLTKQQGSWKYRFITTSTVAYSRLWQKKLSEADTYSSTELKQLDTAYTHYLARQIKKFIKHHGLHQIDAVCSHGHTILHQPENHYTLQIGNLPKLADLIQVQVICNFRVQDVKLGGQGAPLVPIGDQLLFPEYSACINLGGFANISLLKNGTRLAYDLCPVNTVLNFYAQKCGKPFDAQGQIARSGTVDTALLNHLNQLAFYQRQPPKSLGIEWVKKHLFPLLKAQKKPPKDLLATLTQHIAQQLSKAVAPLADGRILVTGGGAYNDFLIESFQKQTTAQIVIPNKELIAYKEALIFGLLGVLRLRKEVNVLRSVTGAAKDHSSGFIYQPTRS